MNNQKFGKLSTQTLQSSLSNEFLQLIVLPTEQCNFRCTYCYEDFEIGRMSESVVTGIKNLLNKRVPELKGFQFMWFGGEPLAAKDIMIELARFARDLCARHGVHFASGDVTTNGYLLTPETVTDLLAANQNYFQVSLDGFGEVHNQTRKLMSGGGTFDRIWANLLAMKERSDRFGVTLRLHLTNANFEGQQELCHRIVETFKGDNRFRVFFKRIENLGGKNGAGLAILDQKLADSNTMKLRMALGQTTSITVDDLKDQAICYASKPNSLMIRANGSIGKCTVALDDPKNNLGTINEDGTLTINNDTLAPWLRGFISGKPSELMCPMHGLPDLGEKKIIPIQIAA